MKVFIVEDSASMLKNLQSTLSDIPGVAVIGHAVDEAGAIERINALRPDVVTLDLQLETGSGFDVLKSIKKHHFRTKVVVLTNCTSVTSHVIWRIFHGRLSPSFSIRRGFLNEAIQSDVTGG